MTTAAERKEEACALVAAARARALPRATIADFHPELRATIEKVIEGRPEIEAALTAHLAHYVAPPDCPGCEWPGSFTWGLVHGARNCSRCKWPGRFYHLIEDERPEAECGQCGKPKSEHAAPGTCPDGESRFLAPRLFRLETVLWAHPEEVGTR